MIVIPMSGLSLRFADAGYDKPKYMLQAGGRSLFRHSVESFKSYFPTETFLFVYRDIERTRSFIEREIDAMGILNVLYVELDRPTRGQAETVYLGLKGANCPPNLAITIFNIDTVRRNLVLPREPQFVNADGYLEVFVGSGNNWSFVEAQQDGSSLVQRTAEKLAISNLCCTGLYHFRTSALFESCYLSELNRNIREDRESYVAPLYNKVIGEGGVIRYYIIDIEDVTFSGIPAEYEAFKRGLV